VLVDDALDNGQLNYRFFELPLPVQALENAKEFVCMFHAEPSADSWAFGWAIIGMPAHGSITSAVIKT